MNLRNITAAGAALMLAASPVVAQTTQQVPPPVVDTYEDSGFFGGNEVVFGIAFLALLAAIGIAVSGNDRELGGGVTPPPVTP